MARVALNSSDFERSRQVYVVIIQTPVSQNKIPILVNLHYAIEYCIAAPALTLNKCKTKNAYNLALIYIVAHSHGLK